MSETYDPSPIPQDEGVTMPEDGDDLTAASVRASLEEHSDAIDALQAKVAPPDGSTADIPRVVHARLFSATNGLERVDSDTGNPIRKFVATSASAIACYDLDLPHGHRLRELTLRTRSGGTVTLRVYQENITSTVDYGGDIDEQPLVTQLASTVTDPAVGAAITDVTYALAGEGFLIDRLSSRYYAIVTISTSGGEAYGFIAKTRIPAGNSIDVGAA